MGEEFLNIEDSKDAENIIRKLFDKYYPPRCESVSINDSGGCVLFEDVIASMDFPPFNRALKDGYCVRISDTYGASEENPSKVKIIDTVEAGDTTSKLIKPGECVRISTGAIIPEGGEAIVMVEYTNEDDEGNVYLYSSLTPGEEIGVKGSDIKKGDTILKRGDFLTSSRVGVIAGQGISNVKVYKKPSVGVISTGDELTPVGKCLSEGKVYDINSVMLESNLKSFNISTGNLGIISDDYDFIKSRILEGASDYDIVLISGGTSSGEGDNLRKILDEIGKVYIHGISIQPGKPTLVGVVNGKLVIGLPGNPVSALVVFNVFILPYIKGLIGFKDDTSSGVEVCACLTKRVHSAVGREQYQLVKFIGDDCVEPIFKDSGAIFSLVSADGYIKIGKNTEMVLEGEKVEVKLF